MEQERQRLSMEECRRIWKKHVVPVFDCHCALTALCPTFPGVGDSTVRAKDWRGEKRSQFKPGSFLWFVLILKNQMAGFHQIFPAESSERFAWCFDVFCPIQEMRRLRKDRALRAGCSTGEDVPKSGLPHFKSQIMCIL